MKYLLLFTLVQYCYAEYAYVSTLSSEDFVLAAKVLAYRLLSFNDYPYLIIATEDVSNSSIESLTQMGVRVSVVPKIDTPYRVDHKENKYQYTKIHLWSLTNYTRLLHLDLDVLPLSDIKNVFKCGTFCASFRHSDQFNSGVFVLQPDMTVYGDMLDKMNSLSSYDGGDQGYLNSYFHELKYTPMFNDQNTTQIVANTTMRTLSAAYNYDIAMYYLNGKMLIHPKIVHYTLGPTKPWIWWTYPLFDLNWEWLNVRYAMEASTHERNKDINLLFVTMACAVILHAICVLTKRNLEGFFMVTSEVESMETYSIPIIHLLFAIFCAFECVPTQTHPSVAWIYFFVTVVMMLVFFSSLYKTLRFGQSLNIKDTLNFVIICLSLFFANWMALLSVINFHHRLLIMFCSIPLTASLVCVFQRRYLVGTNISIDSKYSMVQYSNQLSPVHVH